MNRIYQVIWSSVKDCYVVVSENAGRHGKKKAVHLAPSTTKRTMLAMSLGAAVLMGSGAAAEAAPTGENATISGGVNGDASGKYSSISGGGDNEAIGEAASVSGGSQGKATGTRASVTGGFQNQAAGECATVNGGSGNKAFGWGSSIIGGTGNVVGKMAVDENGNPKLKDSKGNDVVATIKTDGKGNTYLVDSKGNVIKDANPYTDSNSFAGSVAVAIGGMSSSVQGNYSVGIAGGSTSEAAEHGLAAGRKATVTMANGVAIGYESTASVINSSRAADKEGRIVSFGHQKGDVYYDVDYQNHIVTEHKYDSAAYNRLVNVADGIDDHDVVVMEQLKVLASQGMNFQGNDTSNSVHLDQGGTLQIQGSGRKNDTEYSTQNVKVLTDTANKRLSIALDKNPTFDSVTAGTENSTSGGGQAGSIKIVGANSSSANKATTITAGYAASPELSGTRGTGRISYTDGDGTAHTVAILGDGLKLAGDTGTGSVALDKTLTVSGGAANLADGNNIGVTANESTLLLKLAKDITGLDTVTAGGVKMGTQSDGNDTTKSGKYVTGLDNTAWTVGQSQPVTGRAATEDQLKSVSDEVNNNKTQITTNTENIAKGLNFSASNKVDGTYKTVKKNLGDTVAVRASDAKDDHTYKTDNLTTEIDDNGIITVKMDTQLTADKVTVGTGDNAITIDGSNGSLKTGSSTLNGTGLTINNGPSVTTSGISGGNQKMTNVASGKSGDAASGNPVYETDTNAANIGDVKKIVAKTVTVSGDDKNTKVDKTTKADGTVDYKVSLNDSVTLGSDAGKKIALDGTAGTVSVGDKITLNGNAGTAAIGGATLGNDGADTYLTGLTNKTWDGTAVSGRAATEDQLKTVSDSIKTSVNNAQFGITAGGLADGGDVTVKKNLGESIRIYGDAPVTNEKNDGSGDFWDCSKANILTKVKKDHDGNDYVSVELQDHLEVGVHAGTDTDDKAVEGTDGSMQFKGKSTKEVNITGDTGVILSDGDGQARTQTAALRQNDGTGYLDLAGSKGAFTSLFTKQGKQNLSQEDAKKSDTRLTYTDNSSKTEHQVATMDDGLVIAGDNGQVTRLLNSTLKLSGGADTTKLSDGKNIGVVANSSGDGLDIKLAKDLTDIDSINMTGGLKLNSSNGSSTITGLTNTSVTLPDFGKAGRAATEEQLQQVKDGITNAKQGGGFGLTADGDDQVNSPKAKADLGGTIGIHGDSNITTSVSDDGKSINIKLKKDVDLGNDGSIKAGGVTIDNKGIDAGGKNITNVKSGVVKGDDSDNGNAANIGDVKHIVDGKLGDVNGKIDNITKDVSTIKQTKRTYQGDDGKVVNVDFGGALSLTGGATEVAEDKNIGVVKNGENGLSLRLAKKLNGLESVTTGKTTMDDNGLTIMNGDNKPGTAVTGSGIKIASGGEGTHAVELTNSNVSMGGQQVHGVADGTSDDDAVNVSQLKKSVGAIGGAIDKVDRRVDRVGAGAAALAALHPQDFDPDDKWDFAVGYGNYRGANAAAVGAFYKPNEDTTFSVGGTVGGGENMVNAGISFKFGQGNHVSNSRVAMAKEIKDLRKEVEDLRSALVDVAAGKQLDPAKTKLLPDMPKNHWAYKEISELAGNGLLDGDPDGEFKGDRMMTRYEFASIVYRQMMAGRELSDRLVQEFEPELERIRIDVVARHKDGTSSIERVRVNKPADKNSK